MKHEDHFKSPPKWTCALWYWRHFSLRYELFETEEEAAMSSCAMINEGTGSPEGIQFDDGTFVLREDWEVFRQAQEREDARMEAAAATVPVALRPTRRVLVPYGGTGTVEVDADAPAWLGGQP